MSVKFKVWVQVEKCDYKNGDCENVSEPEELGCFDTEDQAYEFMYSLESNQEKMAPALEEEVQAPAETSA